MRPANQHPVPPSSPASDAAGHLPLPLLRQYVAGVLPAAEQHRVEAHTLDCARCAEILEGLELTDPATTGQALLQLQQRLHQRLAQEQAPRYAARAWQAVAAAVVLLLVSTALWWGLRRPLVPASESRPVAVQVPTSPPTPAPEPAAPAATSAAAAGAAREESKASAAAPTPAASAVADPAPALRRPTVVARRTRRLARAVASVRQAEPATATTLSDQAAPGSVAMQAPVAAAPSRVEAPEMKAAESRVLLTQKTAADTVATNPPAVAKAPAPIHEESAKRAAALPAAPVISPQPVEGYLKLREYLRREAMFRPEYPAPPLSGSVRVRFTVKADGTLDNFKILRGLRRDYDQEAIRLLCEGPAWQPGAANGRRADQTVDIIVTF